MALVGVVIGSKTDTELIQPALDTLKQLGIDYELSVISAHRKPEKVREYGLEAEKKGLKVII
ncbi:MAG TPA: AIR carboxylase family protein, partial [Dehalococcoidia bacterium]